MRVAKANVVAPSPIAVELLPFAAFRPSDTST